MAQGDVLTNKRLNAAWQIAATLNMANINNDFLTLLRTQPDGAYAEANMDEAIYYLKWYLGKDASLAKWFPQAVYQAIIGKIVDFNYNRVAVGDTFKPPANAAEGSGQCTCDSDSILTRNVLCFKWDFTDFQEEASGTESGGWTFSGLSAGTYILVFDDYSTNESFPTAYLTVT